MLGAASSFEHPVTMPASSGEMAVVCEPPAAVDAGRLRGNRRVVRGKTVAGVTAEAREVLEQFLRRSLSETAADQRPDVRRRPRKQLGTITENSTDVPDTLTSVEGRPIGGSSDGGLDVVDGFVLDRLRRSDGRGLPESQLSLRTGQQDSVRTNQTEQSIRSTRSSNVQRLPSGKIAEPEESDLSDVENNGDSPGGRAESTEGPTKKKKSGFKRARERLRVMFSRQRDGSTPADKKRGDAGATLPTSEKRNWFGSSLRRKQKKIKIAEGGSTEDGSLGNGSTEWKRKEKSWTMGADDSRTGSRVNQARTKNLFSSLQKRVNSFRLKRSSSRAETPSTPLSQSGDEIGIHPITDSQHKILDKYAANSITTSADAAVASGTDVAPCATDFGHNGHHSVRKNLHLSLIIPVEPVIQDTCDAKLSASLCERTKSWKFIDEDEIDGGGEDEVDGVFSSKPVTRPDDTVDAGKMGAAGEIRVDAKMLSHATTRPFNEKSPTEKEELYDQIAGLLDTIGDDCNTRLGAAGGSQAGISIEGLASALLQNAAHLTYTSFKQVASQVVSQAVDSEPNLKQIALMFHFCSAAVKLAGPSTALVNNIKDMTAHYFADHFASWIIERGGWESMVEDGTTTTDSELD